MRYSMLPFASLLLLIAACQEPAERDPDPPATGMSQVQHGRDVYAANCARCHGDSGEGKKAPPLVGADALPLQPRPDQELRKQPFRTAADVARFAMHEMPPDANARRNIRESDYWAVVAFALNANGVAMTEPLGPRNAGSIVLHR